MVSIKIHVRFRPLWGSFLFLYNDFNISDFVGIMFPSPMGIFFISIYMRISCVNYNLTVSVPYGDLFYFYHMYDDTVQLRSKIKFPSPMGIFFISIPTNFRAWQNGLISFRPLWGSFLFLSCPMETLPGLEKTCTLRCKKFSPAKSGDSKLFKCSVPRFYALRCKTTILLVLSSPSLDHKYDLTE